MKHNNLCLIKMAIMRFLIRIWTSKIPFLLDFYSFYLSLALSLPRSLSFSLSFFHSLLFSETKLSPLNYVILSILIMHCISAECVNITFYFLLIYFKHINIRWTSNSLFAFTCIVSKFILSNNNITTVLIEKCTLLRNYVPLKRHLF